LILLKKLPFERGVPPNGDAIDVGSRVRITATIFGAGAELATSSSAVGDVLIPDRFLNYSAPATPLAR